MKIPRLRFSLLLFCSLLAASGISHAEVRLPAIIGDNMVLQQGMKVRIWGQAAPGEHIKVNLASQTASATTDDQGRWQTLIGPFKAGGPFTLTIAGSNTLVLKNVLVGEVWICSGQSNMEWPLINARGGSDAVAQANYPEIHLFTVSKATSSSPLDDVQGRWVVTTPDQVGQFSAVGYFFGRELYQHLKTPIGLIHTSWGGTPAESWTSHAALASVSALKPILDRYEQDLGSLPERRAKYQQALAHWIAQNLYTDPGNKGEALGYADPTSDTSGWSKMKLPQFFETAGLNIDGAVWFRKEVEIPASWAGKDLILHLTAIDDYDTTYFNGVKVGATGSEVPDSYAVPRKYVVPASLVH